jgi:hypothetical protein
MQWRLFFFNLSFYPSGNKVARAKNININNYCDSRLLSQQNVEVQRHHLRCWLRACGFRNVGCREASFQIRQRNRSSNRDSDSWTSVQQFSFINVSRWQSSGRTHMCSSLKILSSQAATLIVIRKHLLYLTLTVTSGCTPLYFCNFVYTWYQCVFVKNIKIWRRRII